MTKNRLVIEQCSYYIGAQKDKIGSVYQIVVSAIYCFGATMGRHLYHFRADRKSSVPRSGRWMTAIFFNY